MTLNGPAAVTIEAGTSWTDPGATAADTCGADLTGAIQVTGQVHRRVPGVYVLTYFVSDGFNSSSVTRTVTVVDTVAPWLSPVIVAPSSIKASQSRMADVLVLYLSVDVTGWPVCTLGVTSNQPVFPNTDWQVLGPYHVRLRAERTGSQNRIYTITATCSDASGNMTARSDTVTVRK